jgi:hypothetical protein
LAATRVMRPDLLLNVFVCILLMTVLVFANALLPNIWLNQATDRLQRMSHAQFYAAIEGSQWLTPAWFDIVDQDHTALAIAKDRPFVGVTTNPMLRNDTSGSTASKLTLQQPAPVGTPCEPLNSEETYLLRLSELHTWYMEMLTGVATQSNIAIYGKVIDWATLRGFVMTSFIGLVVPTVIQAAQAPAFLQALPDG